MLSFTQPLSRSHAAIRGLLAAAVGIVLMVWPGITIGIVVALFAIYCFADAAVSTMRLFTAGRPAGDRMLLGVRALIEVAAAIAAIAYPGATAQVMTVVIGLYAVAVGVTELAGSRTLSRLGADGTGWLVLSGALAIVSGALLIFWPGLGAVTLALISGAYLAVSGVALLVSAAMSPRSQTLPTHA
jgi:uncharacterized membrane protein HdeD (DUF308 family)